MQSEAERRPPTHRLADEVRPARGARRRATASRSVVAGPGRSHLRAGSNGKPRCPTSRLGPGGDERRHLLPPMAWLPRARASARRRTVPRTVVLDPDRLRRPTRRTRLCPPREEGSVRRSCRRLVAPSSSLAPLAGIVLGVAPPAAAQDEGARSATESARGTLVDKKGTRERRRRRARRGRRDHRHHRRPARRSARPPPTTRARSRSRCPARARYIADARPRHAARRRRAGARATQRLEFTVSPNQSRAAHFDLGARTRDVTTTLDQLPQLGFTGIRFGLIIAITAGRAVAHLRHHRAHQLRPRRDGHLRRRSWRGTLNVDHGMHFIPAALIAIVVGGAGGRADGLRALAPAAQPGREPAGDDDRVDRPEPRRPQRASSCSSAARPSAYRDYQDPDAASTSGPINVAPKDLWSIGIIARRPARRRPSCSQRTRIGKAMRAVVRQPRPGRLVGHRRRPGDPLRVGLGGGAWPPSAASCSPSASGSQFNMRLPACCCSCSPASPSAAWARPTAPSSAVRRRHVHPALDARSSPPS